MRVADEAEPIVAPNIPTPCRGVKEKLTEKKQWKREREKLDFKSSSSSAMRYNNSRWLTCIFFDIAVKERRKKEAAAYPSEFICQKKEGRKKLARWKISASKKKFEKWGKPLEPPRFILGEKMFWVDMRQIAAFKLFLFENY